VVSSLSESRLFATVAYADATSPSPVVVIEPMLPPPGGYCDGQDLFLPFLTLGLVPTICERDRGVYFRFVGRRLPAFACRWPQSEMVGWFPVLLAAGLGSWTREGNEEAFVAHLRACVASASEGFELAAGSH
jgi:hypothetical protein